MDFYKNRLNQLREYMKEKSINLSLISNPDHQFYLTGFKALIYSRPILLAVSHYDTNLVIPSLEGVHAREKAKVDNLYIYSEVKRLADHYTDFHAATVDLLNQYKHEKIGADFDSFPVSLERHLSKSGSQFEDVGSEIIRMRFIKEKEEIEQIREVSEWINLAVKRSLESAESGITELEVDDAGNSVLYQEIPKKYPNATLQLMGMSPAGTDRSVMPHVFSNARKLKEGDVMIHTRQVSLNGYRTELERTVFLGEPTEEQKKAFKSMLRAQEAAMQALKPGRKASEIDDVAMKVFEEDGYIDYAVHRTGHGIGISPHEEPYIRFDNDLILEEGMVFTIEPGLYIPGVGGFRHSDTLVVTKEGNELLTKYPRKLEELIL
ncbi:M24 family metallopeptidase [Halobacillus andaensis]|uniref:M24 family metallopeptidase n=1 Tax=Halobacillus andaensis TaxID=1176239 RepID=UPI003D726957